MSFAGKNPSELCFHLSKPSNLGDQKYAKNILERENPNTRRKAIPGRTKVKCTHIDKDMKNK